MNCVFRSTDPRALVEPSEAQRLLKRDIVCRQTGRGRGEAVLSIDPLPLCAERIDALGAERQRIDAEDGLSAATAGLTADYVALQKALGLGWLDQGPRIG